MRLSVFGLEVNATLFVIAVVAVVAVMVIVRWYRRKTKEKNR